MSKDNLSSLYNGLIKKGYSVEDIGDEATFRTKMADKNNRKQLYDYVSSRGDFRIGDYDSYEKRLTSVQEEQPQQTEPPQQQTEIPAVVDTAQVQSPEIPATDTVQQQAEKPLPKARRKSLREQVGGGMAIAVPDEVEMAAKFADSPQIYDPNANIQRALAEGKLDTIINEDEEKRISAEFKPKPVVNPADIYENYSNRFSLTERGKQLSSELAGISQEVQNRYANEFLSSDEYRNLQEQYKGEELDKKANEAFSRLYSGKIDNELQPYVKAYLNEAYSRYGQNIEDDVAAYNEEIRRKTKDQIASDVSSLDKSVNAQLEENHRKLSARAGTGGSAFNALMGSASYNAGSAQDRKVKAELEAARQLVDESNNIISEARKKGKTNFVAGLGRGIADAVFDANTWSFGLQDMRDASVLVDALDKFDRGETLTESEQTLMDAAVANMAVNAYYYSDLGRGYKAGTVSGQSIPFMLEFAINPVSASGSAIAKNILKYGMKKFGKSAVKNNAAKFAARLVGDAAAAAAMTGTSSAARVAAGTMERAGGDIQLDESGTGYAGRTGQMGIGEALGKSFASTTIENQSEMVFNAFSGLGSKIWKTIEKYVPGGVAGIMDNAIMGKAGDMYRKIKSNPTLKEVARRTQFHGLIGEYMEELYSNFAHIPLGEMTLEEATDLDNNIDTFLGLAPTSVAFGIIGLGGLAAQKTEHRKKLKAAFGNMTRIEKNRLAKLEELAEKGGNEDIKRFIRETMLDTSLTPEEKKAEIEYAYNLAVGNAIDDVEAAQQEEVTESNATASEEGAAIYAEHNPETMRQTVLRREVAEQRLVDAGFSIDKLKATPVNERQELLSRIDEENTQLVVDFFDAYDREEAMNEALDTAHEEEVSQARSMLQDIVLPNQTVTVVPLGQYGTEQAQYGVVVSGIDAQGNPTQSNGAVVTYPVQIVNGIPDFSTIDKGNPIVAIPKSYTDAMVFSPDEAFNGMLTAYQQDAAILEGTPIVPGAQFPILLDDGSMQNVTVAGTAPTGESVVVLPDGKTASMSAEELSTRKRNAELAPIMAEQAEEEQIQQQAVQEAATAGYSEEVRNLQPQVDDKLVVDGRNAVISEIAPDGLIVNLLSESGDITGTKMIPLETYYDYKQSQFNQQNNVQAQSDKDTADSVQETTVEGNAADSSGDRKATEEVQQAEEKDYPVDEAGEPAFLRMQPQRTVQLLSDTFAEDAASFVSDRLSAAQKAAEKAAKKSPKALGFNERAKELAQIRQEREDAAREVEYWQNISSLMAPEVQPQQTEQPQQVEKKPKAQTQALAPNFIDEAEEASRKNQERLAAMTEEEIAAAQAKVQENIDKGKYDRKPASRRRSRYNDEDVAMGEAYTPMEHVLREIATGRITFQWSDKGATQGLGSHLGLSGSIKDRQKLFWALHNEEGYPPEVAAEIIHADMPAAMQELVTDQDVFNMILDAFSQYGSPSRMFEAAQQLHGIDIESQPGYEEDMERQQLEWEAYHNNMSVKDWTTLVDIVEEELEYQFRTLTDEDINAIFEEIYNEEYGTGRNEIEGTEGTQQSTDSEGGNEVQPQQQSDNETADGRSEVRPEETAPSDEQGGGTLSQPGFTVEKRYHQKDNKDIFAVNFTERMNRDAFLAAKKKAKDAGGYYSSFGKGGFIFDTEEAANNFGALITGGTASQTSIEAARAQVEQNPTEAQKEAGNYRKGHITIDGYNITLENPKGSERSGTDKDGNKWSVTMNNDYGYIRGTEGVDGDHIDVFLSDNPESGKVFVVDQVNEDGTFDEHKVMYGFDTRQDAIEAYLANYSPGWTGLGQITEVSKDQFKKWIESSHRKTKPFAEYKSMITPKKPEEVNGYRKGDKVYYGGKTATIYDFEYDGRPVLDTGLAPVLYTIADWEDVSAYKEPKQEKKSSGMKQISVEGLFNDLKTKGTARFADNVIEETPAYGSQNKVVSTARYEELKKRMRNKLNNLNVGYDPEIIAIGAEMAAYHIEAGARTFIDFAKRMITDMGDDIRPYLKSIYSSARHFPGMEEYKKNMTPESEYDEIDINSIKLEEDGQTGTDTVEVQQEEKPADGLSGNSAEYQERVVQESKAVAEIGRIIRDRAMASVEGNNVEPLSMKDVKKILGGYTMLSDMSATDMQELVELVMTNETRNVALEYFNSDNQKSGYDLIVSMYNMQPLLNARDSTRFERQQYSTPTPFGYVMGQFAQAGKKVGSVLEPSAGNGALTITFPSSIVHVNDIDERRLANLRTLGYGEVTNQDALIPFGGSVDVVMTNPPFGSTTTKELDNGQFKINSLEGLMAINALESMKDDGRAAIVIGGNTSYRENGAMQNKDMRLFSYLYTHYNVVDVINLDGEMYKRNGTKYDVRIILINGRKPDASKIVAPPVKSKARAEQIKSFEELYNRIQDDILRIQQVESVASDTEGKLRTSDTSGGGENRNVGNSGNVGERRRPAGGSQKLGSENNVAGTEAASSTGSGRQGTANVEGLDNGNRPDAGSTGNVPGPQQVAERGGSTESTDERAARPDTTDRGDNTGRSRLAVSLGDEKVSYPNRSQSGTLMSVVPANQAQVLADSLADIGDVDQFLVDELGYSSKDELFGYLAAEQIDSVSLAINQMSKGNGFIIGDMTGVGKGRQGAALIRYAVRKGYKPIYFTQKPALFSDNYRDLADIGSGELRPFIIGSDPKNATITDAAGNVVHKLPSDKERKRVYDYILKNGTLPDEYDYVITTYSQINNGTKEYEAADNGITSKDKSYKKKSPSPADRSGQERRDVIEALSRDNIMILDESHTAGGSGGGSMFMQYIMPGVKGVTFLSATFAKRADNMPIYAMKTDLAKSGITQQELIEAIAQGGVTLQEIMSKQLVQSGQMIRRERSFNGVTIDWLSVSDEEDAIQRKQFDEVSAIFSDIRAFQKDYINPLVESRSEELADEGGYSDLQKGTVDLGASNTPFASKMYNLVNQLLFSLKADAVANRVIDNLKNGFKPVISFTNTMEGFLDEAPKDTPMDVVPNFSLTLLKALDGVMRYTETDIQGEKVNMFYTPDQLGEDGKKKYYEIKDKIENLSANLPISPMDAIKTKIEEAGYKVGEITGRNLEMVRNEDGKYVVRNRKDKDKKSAARDFNNGQIDVLMINKSGSTGISLHASPKFQDQRQRVMVFAQFQSDINDEVQMRGRIDRTGQIYRGKYEYIMSSIPAEQRLQMMFKAKLKSLDANTTSSQKSKFNEMQVTDFLNKYGDEVTWQYMVEHPELSEKLGDPLNLLVDNGTEIQVDETNKEKMKDSAAKIARYLPFLPVKEQEEVFKEITDAYAVKIQLLNDAGENDLEITTMPLKAKTLSRKIWKAGAEPNSGNAFADNTYIEEVEVDVLKKPMKADEIKKESERLSEGKPFNEWRQSKIEEINRVYNSKVESLKDKLQKSLEEKLAKAKDSYVKKSKEARAKGKNEFTDEEIDRMSDVMLDEIKAKTNEGFIKQKNAIEARRDNVLKILDAFEPLKPLIIPTNLEEETASIDIIRGTFVGFKFSKDYSPSSSTAVFATLDGRRKVEIPLKDSKAFSIIRMNTLMQPTYLQSLNIDTWDSFVPTQTRKKAYIVTGNLLQALVDVKKSEKARGYLVSYSTEEGETRQGMLMFESFQPSDLTTSAPIRSRLEQIKRGETVVSEDKRVIVEKNAGWRGGYSVRVPKSKKQGGEFFEDKTLRSLVYGNEFTSKGGYMTAEFDETNLPKVLNRLSNLGVKVADKAKLKDAKDEDIRFRTEDSEIRFRSSSDLVVDISEDLESLINEKPVKREPTYNADNIGSIFYSMSGKYMKRLPQPKDRHVLTEGTIDIDKAIEVYNKVLPVYEDMKNELIGMIPDASMAARREIAAYIEAINNNIDYYKELSEGKDVWRTRPLYRFEFTEEEKEAMDYVLDKIHEEAAKLNITVTVYTSMDEVPQGAARRALERGLPVKGWYHDGQIAIYLPNATGMEDIKATILHEGVAHYGLRKMIGEKNFNAFMDGIYAAASPEVRKEIVRLLPKYNYNMRTAVEEYLATLAESGTIEPTFWEKVKQLFRSILENLGFTIELTDNDLRYLLWESRNNLRASNNPIDVAKETMMRKKLGIGMYGTQPSEDTRFRFEQRPALIKSYDAAIDNSTFRFQEAFQDSMLSLKVLQELIEKQSGMKARSFENAYTAENRLSSVNKVDNERYLENFFKPLLEQIDKLAKMSDRKSVEDYIYAKSGLERNELFLNREADKILGEKTKELDESLATGSITQKQYDKELKELQESRDKFIAEGKDYSGLTGLVLKEYEDELNSMSDEAARAKREKEIEKEYKNHAENIVSEFENLIPSLEVDRLWQLIKAANDENLRKQFDSGMISAEKYEELRNMMPHYVPLRGWEESIAEDFYDYTRKESPVQKEKSAKGRKSLADNPIANIALSAQNAIILGNRNKMKQRFFNFIVNRPNELVTIRDQWYAKTIHTVHDQMEPVYPDIKETDDSATIQRKLEDFENGMKSLEEQGLARRKRMPLGVELKMKSGQKPEHMVSVMINGQEYVMYINGNPRAAQALNGKTNPEGEENIFWEYYNKAKRLYGGGLTSNNPDFVAANFVRDSIHSATMQFLNNGFGSSARFVLNTPKSFKAVFRGVMGKYKPGSKTDQYFQEFIQNGGETGYTAIHTIEDYKREYEKALNEVKGFKVVASAGKKGLEGIIKALEVANRIAEDVNRFNAYMSSREAGKTIEESIDAAKNITVNFNKKGALGKGKGAWAALAWFMNKWILFFNPAVQGLYQVGQSAANNKKRVAGTLATIAASGFIMPYLNALLVSAFGGDDKDDYFYQTDYTRMNNWLIFTGNGYAKIPLPPFFREIYGMGDIFYRLMTNRITPERAAVATLRQLQSAIGFINLIPEGEPSIKEAVSGIMPDLIAPLMDVALNRDFTGRDIAKDTEWTKNLPEYERIYRGVSPVYIETSRFLNDILGGDDARKATWFGDFINPAKIEHIITSYTGGIGRTISNLAGITANLATGDFDNIDMRSIPVINRFASPVTERSITASVNRVFYDYLERYEAMKVAEKRYKQFIKDGRTEYRDELEQMKNNGESELIRYFDMKMKTVRKLQNILKDNPDNKKVEQRIIELKSEMVLKAKNILK